jgi:hypothetical protein
MVAVLKEHNAVGPAESIALERSHVLNATQNPAWLH